MVWSVKGPHLRYPSDARAASDGNVIVADFVNPGGVVITHVEQYGVTQ